jgi:hypothetical protein
MYDTIGIIYTKSGMIYTKNGVIHSISSIVYLKIFTWLIYAKRSIINLQN